jgi:hypothetical protein
LFTLFNKAVRTTNLLSLEEICRVGCPKIWKRVGDKLAATTPYFSCMCKAMARMLELDEESNDGWMTASIAGHSGVHELARIKEAEGLMLEHYGLTHVGQLFGSDDITGRIKTGIDTNFPEDITREQAGLIIICKNLRRALQGRRAVGG